MDKWIENLTNKMIKNADLCNYILSEISSDQSYDFFWKEFSCELDKELKLNKFKLKDKFFKL